MALAAISLVLSACSTLSPFPAHFLAVFCEVPAFDNQLIRLLLLPLCHLTVVREMGLRALVLSHLGTPVRCRKTALTMFISTVDYCEPKLVVTCFVKTL